MRRADIHVVAALDDPQRARLYSLIRQTPEPVSREQAAAAVGISRKLAAFHLERLVVAGLLEVTYTRRTGPTPRGRTPKRYQPSDIEVDVTIPVRHYDFVGQILLEAVAGAEPGETPAAAVARASEQSGRSFGMKVRAEQRVGKLGPERALAILADMLQQQGFEPTLTDDGLLQRNCPFHRLAKRHPELVCGINRDYVEGVVRGLEARRLEAALEPAPDRCCIVVRAKAPSGD